MFCPQASLALFGDGGEDGDEGDGEEGDGEEGDVEGGEEREREFPLSRSSNNYEIYASSCQHK